MISVIKPDGTRLDIISGLPSFGDYGNNCVTFGQDNKMYYGQGTATNSGVVGLDNSWIFTHPYFCDTAGSYITVNGYDFETRNVFIPAAVTAFTGAFSPFGVPNNQDIELLRGNYKASGSIMRANPDGSELELLAWGFRNPFQVQFDQYNRLIVANQGFDNRGSRPIANAPDELQLYVPGEWYGWPDFAGGDPVTLPRFTSEGQQPVRLLFSTIPSTPPRPISTFSPGSNISGFDFNRDPNFATVGDVFIAMFGDVPYEDSGEAIYSGAGHRVARVNMLTGGVSTFAINRSGFPQPGGLSRPTDVKFGPDGAMYVTDYATADFAVPNIYQPNTGVIWRIIKV
jgi:glucose/arabinose dehydrogenase